MLISPAEVAQDRAFAEEQMVDRCRITRAAGPRTFDNATGQYVTPDSIVVFEGRCRMQVRADINSNAVDAEVGDHEWTYRTATLEIPIAPTKGDIGNPALATTGDVVEILASPLDASRVGRRTVIHAETKNKTMASCRKFATRELLG